MTTKKLQLQDPMQRKVLRRLAQSHGNQVTVDRGIGKPWLNAADDLVEQGLAKKGRYGYSITDQGRSLIIAETRGARRESFGTDTDQDVEIH